MQQCIAFDLPARICAISGCHRQPPCYGQHLSESMGGSPGELSEVLVTWEKRKKGWRKNCDVGEATERLENEQSSQSELS